MSRYVVGPTHPNTKPYARFETKAGEGSGAGYERWRSWEWRPHTPRRSKENVYVPVHRLLAVVECYPADMDLSTILAHMDGRDVHHTTGVKWANFGESPNFEEPGIEVVDHGRHSSITQAQMLAWAKDRERDAERAEREPADTDACDECGAGGDVSLWTSADFDGERCTACATAAVDGGTLTEA